MNINGYRRDFAAYNSAFELAHYKHRAGLKLELNTEEIYGRYGDLFTRDAIDELQCAIEETPTYKETERAGLRALAGAARVGHLESRARELTDERAHYESIARIEWEGEILSAHSIPKKIANEPLIARRRELAARWHNVLDTYNDLRTARLESFHDSARILGFDSYRMLFTDITGTDYEELAVSADVFLQRTESTYMSALASETARVLPEVAFSELQYADYLFFQRMTALDPFFPAKDALTTYKASMHNLGIRVEEQQNIHIDDEVRPLKNPRAACFRINPPGDVRMLLAPIGGAYDYITLFHEAGHAQHYGWSSRDLAKHHPEFIYSPDHAASEGYAFLLSHLFHDAAWLVEHRPGISEKLARSIARNLALLMMHNVRRQCAKLRYEITVHDGAQVRSEQLSSIYARLQTEATGFRQSPALYLKDIDDGFYCAAYLRAWAFEAGLREHLRTRYGRRWWATRKAGDDLIDLWNTSSRYTVEELARLIGFGEISFDLLADTLITALNDGI